MNLDVSTTQDSPPNPPHVRYSSQYIKIWYCGLGAQGTQFLLNKREFLFYSKCERIIVHPTVQTQVQGLSTPQVSFFYYFWELNICYLVALYVNFRYCRTQFISVRSNRIPILSKVPIMGEHFILYHLMFPLRKSKWRILLLVGKALVVSVREFLCWIEWMARSLK